MWNETFISRFWEKVLKSEGCWEWQGYKGAGNQKRGYIISGGRGSKMWLASRASWVIHFGEIPIGKQVLHKCDNPSCVRPDHLFLGSQWDNMLDKVKKGRQGRPGPKKGIRLKITQEQVLSVFQLRDKGWSQDKIALQIGLSQVSVSRILRGD